MGGSGKEKKSALLDRRAGGCGNGGRGIGVDMSRQPYYLGYVYDLDGNNIEAVCF